MNYSVLRKSHLIEPEELNSKLGSSHLVIIDMRGLVKATTDAEGFQSAEYLGARGDYELGHIPGAQYVDWTRDIADLEDPIPVQVAPEAKLKMLFERLGIRNDSSVVVYDDHPSMQFSTRLWWVCRYMGLTNVRVLDGGWKLWNKLNLPISIDIPVIVPSQVTLTIDSARFCDWQDMLRWSENSGICLLDARDKGQFTGSVRRGPRGGRIPGAQNVEREAFIGIDGRFKTSEELLEICTALGLSTDTKVAAYCNGGVAATSAVFALSMLGFNDLSVYDGSWNEWSKRPDVPVESDK